MHPFDVRLIELERAQHGLVGIHQLHEGDDEREPWSEASSGTELGADGSSSHGAFSPIRRSGRATNSGS